VVYRDIAFSELLRTLSPGRTVLRKPNTIDPADRQYLFDYYREETRRLADLLSGHADAMPCRTPGASTRPTWLGDR
jgi:hypothetical protein